MAPTRVATVVTQAAPQSNTIYVEGRWDARSRTWIEPHWEFAPPPRAAPVVVVQRPPSPRYDNPGRRPAPGYVWVDGYWAWHGRRYDRVAGHWDLPPRGQNKRETARWDRHDNSYVFVEGQWR